MSYSSQAPDWMEEVRRALSNCSELKEAFSLVAGYLEEAFGCNYLLIESYGVSSETKNDNDPLPIRIIDGSPEAHNIAHEITLYLNQGRLFYQNSGLNSGQSSDLDSGLGSGDDSEVTLPLFEKISPHKVYEANPYLSTMQHYGVRSLAVLALYHQGEIVGTIQCGFLNSIYHWRVKDRILLQQIAYLLEQSYHTAMKRELTLVSERDLTTPASKDVVVDGDTSSYQRLLRYGNLIFISTDTQFTIQNIIGSPEKLFGFSREEMLGKDDVWSKFSDEQDLRRIGLLLRRMKDRPKEFGEEVRFYRKNDPTPRWLLLKASPVFDGGNKHIGWEGFSVDITDKRKVELELRAQRARTDALYEVSKALRVNLDPALVTLKGLKALIRSTGSHAGFCCFYERATRSVEMVAAQGLSQHYVESVQDVVSGKSLVRFAIENTKGLLIDDIQSDSRANSTLALKEGLKSTIVMPLVSGGMVIGAVVIFSHTASRYTPDDFQLVKAAASQISFAAKQAEYYSAEKKEADALGALYRLSHQISKLSSPQEIGEHLFSAIQQEFACRRLWFGVINNQGTHIIGKAGYGPGVRKQIKDVQIELDLQHDFLDTAISEKRSVIVAPGAQMECSGLNRVIQRLNPGTFVVLPILSLGKVVGIILAEPVIGSVEYIKKKLPILNRMMTETGAVLMARRFEDRIATSDKMRVAAVLASGVAHNFNNLLQAIMGQASLIQMQEGQNDATHEIAGSIIDSAGKGASLVKHLLSLSTSSNIKMERFSVLSSIKSSYEVNQSLLTPNISLQLNLPDTDVFTVGDTQSFQQALNNLIINANEAIGPEKSDGLITVSVSRVRLQSGEVDPLLSPGRYLRVDVNDNGVGMDEERLERCFEPFYSTKDLDSHTGLSLSGSGLGLSSAYSLILQQGGIITVQSTLEMGTMFSCYIPEFESRVAEVKEQYSLASERTHLALLIQHQGMSNGSLDTLFNEFGIRARNLPDIETAQVILDSPAQSVSLVVIDADYIGESTVDFIERYYSKIPRGRVVITSISRANWESKLSDYPKIMVVEKPLSLRVLQNTLRSIYDEVSSIRPSSTLSDRVETVVIGSGAQSSEEESKPKDAEGNYQDTYKDRLLN